MFVLFRFTIAVNRRSRPTPREPNACGHSDCEFAERLTDLCASVSCIARGGAADSMEEARFPTGNEEGW